MTKGVSAERHFSSTDTDCVAQRMEQLCCRRCTMPTSICHPHAHGCGSDLQHVLSHFVYNRVKLAFLAHFRRFMVMYSYYIHVEVHFAS